MATRAAWNPLPSQSHAFPLRWSLLIGRSFGRYHPSRTRKGVEEEEFEPRGTRALKACACGPSASRD